MTAAGLLTHTASAGQMPVANRVSPMASSSSGANSTGASNTSSAGITANDFLTLLVTEMKNQDPTANTDPNEYINQLVNVNSLQQLISINGTLTGAFGSSNTSVTAQTSSAGNIVANTKARTEVANGLNATQTPTQAFAPGQNAASDGAIKALIGRFAHGNLSAPPASPEAIRLAHALDGHTGTLQVTK